MKVTVRTIKNGSPGTLEDVVYQAIGAVLWEDDWVRLMPLDSRIQQISYRKELVFAVIEEKDPDETATPFYGTKEEQKHEDPRD
jgi:hypothetical protein